MIGRRKAPCPTSIQQRCLCSGILETRGAVVYEEIVISNGK